MEIRDFAEVVLYSRELEDKLRPPSSPFTDDRSGAATVVDEPVRPHHLRIAYKGRSARMPHHSGFREARLRAVAHHIMANHELQALEVMARTLLAFPDAPPDFRRGVARIMMDEQRHTRMHVRRIRANGLDFGDLPVNGHVWLRARAARGVLGYLACLPLTFESGNLDHSLQFAAAFERAGDGKGRDILRAIHIDEIDHVAFGVEWLRRLKPSNLSDWEAYSGALPSSMRPFHAKGAAFQRHARLQTGMSVDFVDRLEAATRKGD